MVERASPKRLAVVRFQPSPATSSLSSRVLRTRLISAHTLFDSMGEDQRKKKLLLL